jgi:hypothetical protein
MKHVLDINVPGSRQIRVELWHIGNFWPSDGYAAVSVLCREIQRIPRQNPSFLGKTMASEMPNCGHRALSFH